MIFPGTAAPPPAASVAAGLLAQLVDLLRRLGLREVVRELLGHPRDDWWDDVRTKRRETSEDMLRAALSDARMDLTKLLSKDPEKWRWGRLHQMELRSQTFGSSGVGALEWLFNRGPYEVGGGSDAVLATSWRAGTDSARAYGVTTAPSTGPSQAPQTGQP